MGDELSLEDFLIILRRRILYFAIPAVIATMLGMIVVMLLPAKYKAEGTILVESPQIPTDLVQSTVTAYAQERIQTIRQRVLTRNILLEIAAEFSLFPANSSMSESKRVEIMRERFNVDLITASGRTRRNTDGTIAFKVSYTDVDARNAYLTTNELMTRFLDEDVRSRTAGASNTTEFFENETGKLQNTIANVEQQILLYKSENANSLPEHLNMHTTMLNRATQEFTANQASIFQLEEEKQFLETQLVQGATGGDSGAAELARLEAELSRLRASYHDTFPAVQEKRDEISSYKRQLAPSRAIQQLRDALRNAESQLTTLERTETPDEEAVAQAEQNVEAARLALSDKITEESRRGASDAAGAQIDGRIAIIENRIRMSERRSNSLTEEIEDLEGRIALTPAVERGLATLERNQESLSREYELLRSKQQAAQLAENLEQNQQAEKFSIIESATLPDTPSSPDRPKLAVLVLFAACGLGGAIALAVELLTQSIRGSNHLSSIIDAHPIAIIPYIQNDEDRRPFWKVNYLQKAKKLQQHQVQGAAV